MADNHTMDIEDLRLDDFDFEEHTTGDLISDQNPVESNQASQQWQLPSSLVPSNPNTIQTPLSSKIERTAVMAGELRFRFCHHPDDCSNPEATPAPTTPKKSVSTLENWGDMGLSRMIIKSISSVLKFASPTPVQARVIPAAISGKDVLATAATGSGKTAAFLLPVIERLLMSPNVLARRKDSATGRISGGRPTTRAIVLLPTRELAVQCWSMLKALTEFVPITSSLVVGGFDSKDQRLDLAKQPDVILATPGRILDHLLNSQGVHLESVDMVVLDEADRLLELGFKEAIIEILKAIPKKSLVLKKDKETATRGQCQTLLFSATINGNVKELASSVLRDPLIVKVSEENRVVTTLTQEFMKVPNEQVREASFFSLLESSVQSEDEARRVKGRIIVFFREKKEAHRLSVIAQIFGLGVRELHGNMNQAERAAAMADFQAGTSRYLFATDLAGRGLDLPDVSLVINYNLPSAIDAETRYIHRVGRTARMGRSGRSITLYTAEEYGIVKRIVKKAVDKSERVNVFERKIPTNLIPTWSHRISSIRTVLTEIDNEEALEREIFKSSQQLSKAGNIDAHKADIFRRPKKVWIKQQAGKQPRTGRSRN